VPAAPGRSRRRDDEISVFVDNHGFGLALRERVRFHRVEERAHRDQFGFHEIGI